jgi:hypothetical protein
LHKTTGHFESFVLYTEKIISAERAFPDLDFSQPRLNVRSA